MRFGSSIVSYIHGWITLLSALMPVKLKAASCRQYHKGHFDSNRIGHSSVHLFQGDFPWSRNCCMVHEHFHSAHLQTISWMSELSCQPRETLFFAGFTPVPAKPDAMTERTVHQLQYKLVFFFTVDLHQISSQFFAEGLGLVPILDGVAHQVTVALKIRPATGTRTFSVKKRWLFLWTLLELFLRFLLCLVHDQKVSSP